MQVLHEMKDYFLFHPKQKQKNLKASTLEVFTMFTKMPPKHFKFVLIFLYTYMYRVSLWLSQQRIHLGRKHRLNPWVWEICWRREWQPTPLSMGRTPQTDDSGWLVSMGPQRVRHDWVTKRHIWTWKCVCLYIHI